MKRIVTLLILTGLLIPAGISQEVWKMKIFEVSAGFGPSMFFSDIGGYSPKKNLLGLRDIRLSKTSFDLNVNLKYKITRRFNACLGLTYGFLHASDAVGSNVERGFETSVMILEPALTGEFYFIKNMYDNRYFQNTNRYRWFNAFLKSFDFYLFAGIGGLDYTITPNNKLKAEGINTTRMCPVIPGGLGTTFRFSPYFNFGLEIGGRYALSDYVDGYTSRYSKSNDIYYFVNLTFTYKPKEKHHMLLLSRM
jgi:hypothetical protein